MGRVSDRDLLRRGVSLEDLATARTIQDAQRRTGAKVQSLAVIVGVSEPRRPSAIEAPAPVSLTERALRRRGTYDQAALLLDQQALQETSPERAERARSAAQTAKDLSATAQLEFDFFGGNVTLAFQYQDAVTERLRNSGQTLARQHQALAVLWQITRHLGWQNFECSKTAADLCELTGLTPNNMSPVLQLLEDVGAIHRVKRGRTKVIAVTPEGAFRGKVENHAKTVERFRLDVIEGGKTDA